MDPSMPAGQEPPSSVRDRLARARQRAVEAAAEAQQRASEVGHRVAEKGKAGLGHAEERVRRKLDERSTARDAATPVQTAASWGPSLTGEVLAPLPPVRPAETSQVSLRQPAEPASPTQAPYPSAHPTATPSRPATAGPSTHPAPAAQSFAAPPAQARPSAGSYAAQMVQAQSAPAVTTYAASVQAQPYAAPAAQAQPMTIPAPVPPMVLTPARRRPRMLNGAVLAALIVAVIFPPAGLGLAKTARRECREDGRPGAGLALVAHVVAAAGTCALVLVVLTLFSVFAYGVVQVGSGLHEIGLFLGAIGRIFS